MGSSISWFDRFARAAARVTGRSSAFIFAMALIVVWLVTGPIFSFSDTWQLVINTGTSVLTFLMVFLIQATQNRDTTAMHVKLDELIRAVEGARNATMDMEDLTEDELAEKRAGYLELAERAKYKDQDETPAEARVENEKGAARA